MIRDIHAKEVRFMIARDEVLVYSHDSLVERGEHMARVFVGDGEVAALAPSRGEALVDLSDYFLALSKKLRELAFEQEAVIE